MIRIEHIRKKFRKQHVLDDINALFISGQVISLIGPNGSGKTTLIKTILGMVKPDSGIIFINGKSIDEDPAYRSLIGYMPQISRYPDNMKVGHLFDLLKKIRKANDSELDNDLIIKFGIASFFDKPMRALSGGMRQKVSAALAFYFNPPILILDEPTAGLDPVSSEILKEKILSEKRNNKLILITSHILSDLDELTSHIMYLQEGKVVLFKTIEDLKKQTNQNQLSKVISNIMQNEKNSALWVDEILSIKP